MTHADKQWFRGWTGAGRNHWKCNGSFGKSINFLKKLLQKFYKNEESKINNFAMNIEICYTDMWYRGLLQKASYKSWEIWKE